MSLAPPPLDVLPPPSDLPEETAIVRRRLQLWTAGRLIVATLVLGGTLLSAASARSGFSSFTPLWLLGLIVATLTGSIAMTLWVARAKRLEAGEAIQITWDVTLTSGLVYALGGASSAFAFLYGVGILAAALAVGPRATRVAGVIAVLAYLGVGVSVAVGIVPAPPNQPATDYHIAFAELGSALARNIVGLLLVALLADTLAARVRRTGEGLRLAEASAAKLSRLNADIIRSIHSGLLTADAASVILTMNPAGLEIFRASEGEVIGRKVHDLLPSIGDGPPPTPGSELDGQRAEGEAIRPDKTQFPVGHTRTALVDEHGSAVGTLVVFQDLTEVNELRRVAEHAERLAAIGRLAAGLAHEIRNPLGSISGSVELVREAPDLSAEDRRLLGIVLSEVDRLNDLVTTMLEVGRPKPPQRTTVDLAGLVDDVVQMARRGPGVSFGVVIAAEVPAERVEAWADADQLRQVLWNLLKNAIQATPRGRKVEARVYRDEAGLAVVEISDEGKGVSAAERARLFDMFYSSRPQGIGLGLALVKQIVDAHGATIEVRAATTGGALFAIRIPSSGPPPRSSFPPQPTSSIPPRSFERIS